MIVIRINEQTLVHHRPSGIRVRYPVSTAKRGAGNKIDSLQTPLGRHRIAARIGAGLPANTIFRARRPVGLFDASCHDSEHDWILARILWLEGEQTGVNRRGRVDTFSRYIYIHGTHREDLIGRPASHGCIRMRRRDVIDLFARVRLHERVYILP